MTQVAAFRPGLCAGGVVPLRQFKALIGKGCELNSCLRNNAELEQWLPTCKSVTSRGHRLPGVPLLEMGWNCIHGWKSWSSTGDPRQDKYPGIPRNEYQDGDWHLDAVRNECGDGSASSFADELDEAIRSLEQGSEQPAGRQQLHDMNAEGSESGEHDLADGIEIFGFSNALEIALGVLEEENYQVREYAPQEHSMADSESCHGNRTLEWILDNLVRCGSSASSDFISDEELRELQM